MIDLVVSHLFNPFVPNASFLYPLKISENLSVSRCFQWIEKGCIGNEWVKLISCHWSLFIAPETEKNLWCSDVFRGIENLWCSDIFRGLENLWCSVVLRGIENLWCSVVLRGMEILWCSDVSRGIENLWYSVVLRGIENLWCSDLSRGIKRDQ